MSDSVHTIPAMLLEPTNVNVALGISLISRIEAEILRHFISIPVLAAILRLTPTSHSFHISPGVFLDHENTHSQILFNNPLCYIDTR